MTDYQTIAINFISNQDNIGNTTLVRNIADKYRKMGLDVLLVEFDAIYNRDSKIKEPGIYTSQNLNNKAIIKVNEEKFDDKKFDELNNYIKEFKEYIDNSVFDLVLFDSINDYDITKYISDKIADYNIFHIDSENECYRECIRSINERLDQINYHYDGYVYAGTVNNGKIYRSNNGTTWTEVSDTTDLTEVSDTTDSHINSLTSHSDGYVYSGENIRKIFRNNNGNIWTKVVDITESNIGSLTSYFYTESDTPVLGFIDQDQTVGKFVPPCKCLKKEVENLGSIYRSENIFRSLENLGTSLYSIEKTITPNILDDEFALVLESYDYVVSNINMKTKINKLVQHNFIESLYDKNLFSYERLKLLVNNFPNILTESYCASQKTIMHHLCSLEKTIPISMLIEQCINKDPSCLSPIDEFGDTPLHILFSKDYNFILFSEVLTRVDTNVLIKDDDELDCYDIFLQLKDKHFSQLKENSNYFEKDMREFEILENLFKNVYKKYESMI